MSHTVVGKPIPRIEGAEKVTGKAGYAADVRLPGLLWGKLARSPLPHARILHISADKARALPGVPPPPPPPPTPLSAVMVSR
jgi:CO/xanthine dehydrogenase Mo-binding subunit